MYFMNEISTSFQTYKYMCLPILDTPKENIGKYFRQAYYFIHEALTEGDQNEDQPKNNVLIHW